MSSKKLVELKDRIKYIREKAGLNKMQFAQSLFITPTYVTTLESGKNLEISENLAELISIKYKVNREWAHKGKGDIYSELEGVVRESMGEYNIADEYTGKILELLNDMDEDQKRSILYYIKKEKLLSDLIKKQAAEEEGNK